LKLKDDDLRALENVIAEQPERDPVMAGTGGLRKIRFAPASWGSGKSGAIRVGFAFFPVVSRIYLVTVFRKNEKGNLSQAEKKGIKELLARLARALR
jgi:hypothetical protein